MNTCSSILVLGAALSVCLALALCGALFVGGYVFFAENNVWAILGASAAFNRIVYVGNDANIYVTDPSTGNQIALTQDGGAAHAYNYPTWSPDNHRVAFVGYTFENGDPTQGALYTVAPNGEKLTPVFKTTENFPFYLYWSPDSQFVGFLSNKDAQNLALRVAHTDQPDSTQELDTGAPFYWAWSPDSAQLFTHVGGARTENNDARLALLNVQNKREPYALQALPGAFQAPQWSRDGKILYSTQEGETQAIALGDAQGNELQKLTKYRGRASFALAPDGAQVAYLVTAPDVQIPHYGPVRVVNANGENIRAVTPKNVLAFLWSPDSKKIAFLTIELPGNQQNFQFRPPPLIAARAPEQFSGAALTQQGGELRLQLQWNVWDSTTDETRRVATFAPSNSFLNVLPYFDQYANSSTFWSPDSQALVYTARETGTSGTVWVADITGKNPVKQVGEGVLAFWSWK
ncbi:MAG: PD40 domain-containing protein [Chloroflexi bacterium]|nr:PD40 domain-containing protein [Chloroflexota bacterium]